MHDVRDFCFLVTGGAGFIGSNLVEYLLEHGAKVRVLDDFSTGRASNIKAFAASIDLIEGDLCVKDTVARAVEGVDYVLHQGAIPSVPRSIEDPIRTSAVNVGGTINILTAGARVGVKRVVIASSSSVYGDTEELPKREDLPLAPLSPYAAGKAACELFCKSFEEVFKLETVCLRYFNIFGPRQDPTSQYSAVIPRFIDALRLGKPLTIYGDGEQTRDFTYVGNVVDANIRACFEPGAVGGRFNIGCGKRYSLLELGKVLAQIMGRPVHFQHHPPRAGDVRHSQADITRAEQNLGYTPLFELKDGLARTVEHFIKVEV